MRAPGRFRARHQAGHADVLALAFGESLAFISLLNSAWGRWSRSGALIGASASVLAGLDRRRIGAALGDWSPMGSASIQGTGRADVAAVALPGILPRGEAFVENWGVPSIFIGRFFGPLRASVPLACRIFEMPYWEFSIGQLVSALGLVGGLAAVRRCDRCKSPMAVRTV